ncbi:MAG TPA: 2OG-Fe(II) oxygenase [Dyella sp.]|uniref:2OG-Fe(II) oxygenase n=1 Tax=Dyella sp. TaxID=1869338 RepID=UPI002F92E4E0
MAVGTTLCLEHPLPETFGACLLWHGFLTPDECTALIADAEQHGFQRADLDYPPSYRDNDRQVRDDPDMADRLWHRLRQALPQLGKAGISGWEPIGINERLRLCRYGPGQQFRIHRDGVHHRDPHCRSALTFMVYLTDGAEFDGGDTLFFAGGPGRPGDPVARIRPRRGSLILFDHDIWHAGDIVTRGSKHILRSDVLYHRKDGDAVVSAQHLGYVWTLLKLADGRIASAGRDTAIRLWDSNGDHRGCLQGHRQSVLGLAEIRPGLLASVSRDRSLRLWDVARQACIHEATAHEAAALCVAALPGRELVATGGADARIHVWSERGQRLCTCAGHDGWIWALACCTPGRLFSASEDGMVKCWELDDSRCLGTWPGEVPLRSIDAHLLPDGSTRLAVGDADGWIRLGIFRDGCFQETRRIKAHTAAIRRVRFFTDGTLATCGEDGALRQWDSPSLRLRTEDVREPFVTDVLELDRHGWLSSAYDGALRYHRPLRSATEPRQLTMLNSG